MSAFELIDQENFDTRVIASAKPYLVEFGAPWCAPCKRLEPELEKLVSGLVGRLNLGKIDVDASADLAMQYNVMGVPTVILFVDGQPKKRMTGFQPLRKLEQMVEDEI